MRPTLSADGTNVRTMPEAPRSDNTRATSRDRLCLSRHTVYAVQFRWIPTTHEATTRIRFPLVSGSGRGSTESRSTTRCSPVPMSWLTFGRSSGAARTSVPRLELATDSRLRSCATSLPISARSPGSIVEARSDNSSNVRVDSWNCYSANVGKSRCNPATYRRRFAVSGGRFGDNCPSSLGPYAVSATRYRRNCSQIARVGGAA
jgi:hypothetical protein